MRILETMRETFWVLALAVIVLFVFFVALGALSPSDAVWATAIVEGRHRDRRDRGIRAARERRGF